MSAPPGLDPDRTDPAAPDPADEPHSGTAGRLNWLRAGVLGANDGIVSVAGIVVGVAGATADRGPIFTAGLAGLVAGAVSMALGEYVSVSSQRDSETGAAGEGAARAAGDPRGGAGRAHGDLPRPRGCQRRDRRTGSRRSSPSTTRSARTWTPSSGIDPDDLANPLHAAVASAIAFTLGARPAADRDPAAAGGLAGAGHRRRGAARAGDRPGAVSARIGGSSPRRAVIRVVVGGAAGLALTYAIGTLFGTAIG